MTYADYQLIFQQRAGFTRLLDHYGAARRNTPGQPLVSTSCCVSVSTVRISAQRAHSTPVVPALEHPSKVAISHRSLLYWSEHCVECAAPACYRTCDLFERRILSPGPA